VDALAVALHPDKWVRALRSDLNTFHSPCCGCVDQIRGPFGADREQVAVPRELGDSAGLPKPDVVANLDVGRFSAFSNRSQRLCDRDRHTFWSISPHRWPCSSNSMGYSSPLAYQSSSCQIAM
jgi:hypothetical protein